MKNLFKRTALNRTIFFISADVVFAALSVWLSFVLRFDGNIPEQYNPFILKIIILLVIFLIPTFYFNKLYSFSWSYVSASELISLFRATSIAFIFLAIAIFISDYFPRFLNFPRSTIFISYILVFIFVGAVRFSKRIYLRITGKGGMSGKEKTLIVGAGDAGEQILRSIISSDSSSYSLMGMVDDNPIKQNVVIHGYKVLGKIADIPEIVKKEKISQLIIAFPSAGRKAVKYAVELGRRSGIEKIKIAPPLSEVIQGKVSFKDLKNVEAEDLLFREKVSLDKKQIESFIKGKSVLITGAAGSIGSELSRQVAKFKPSSLLVLDQDETGIFNVSGELENDFPSPNIYPFIADIRDQEKMEEIFKKFRPKIIFHAAAYKHVPLMEKFPDEAVKNNIFGTKILADCAVKYDAEKFIFVSTDKAVNPSSVMGATKRFGEMVCQAENQKNNTKFISVRFGNVLNSRGSVIPIFREQIKRGGPVEVTHPEMKRYFMLISEACLLVMQAGAMGEGGEVFVLDMGKPIKILDLARDMIKLSGLQPDKDIAIVFTKPRQGEKLFEEILTAEEGTTATSNKKIFVAKLSEAQRPLDAELGKLKQAVLDFDKEEIINILKNNIPCANIKT